MSSLSPPLVQIPNVSAAQLVGSERIILKSGTLTLTLPPPDSPGVKLLLNIGTLTIPLSEHSVVGTKNSLTYLFTLPLSATDTGFVEVTLPPSADDETTEVSRAATEFEGVLVGYGFLKVGLVADADDMARAVKDRIDGDGEAYFSNTTNKAVSSIVGGSGRLVELSGRISNAVSSATFEAGRWVGGKLGGGGPERDLEADEHEEKSTPREAADRAIASGLEQGAACMSSTVGKSAPRIVEHQKGQEAKILVENARQTTGDARQVAADTTLATSFAWQAGEAGMGAAKAEI